MKATQQLKNEHEAILLMLKILEKISDDLKNKSEINHLHVEQVIDFVKGFADKCHHGKEEDILFPSMINKGLPEKGGPIAVMLHEHDLGRQYVAGMVQSAEELKKGNKEASEKFIQNADGYINLLRNHIEKENNVLFMMADKFLDEAEQDKIFEEFEKMETEKIGAGKHEEYHHTLNELKNIYLK